MKNASLDSSLLSIFRLFVFVRLIFSVITPVANLIVPRFRFTRLQPFFYLPIIEAVILLAYLSWPWLYRRMGKWYIPVALAIATIAPIVENYLTLDFAGDELSLVRAISNQWQLVIFLMLPLILVSWMYNFRTVAAYCLVLLVPDLGLLAILWHQFDARVGPILIVTLIRTAIYLLIGYAISRLSYEQRRQNSQLAEANRHLATYANTLEQLTISRERNRIAREMHDTLAHTLSAVAVQLEAVHSLWEANPGEAHVMLDQSLVVTRDGLKEARRAIQALRTAPLEDLGLGLAIRNLAQSMAERGSLKLDLQVPDEVAGLDAETEHSLYRITEEALRNVVQHAGAHKVGVAVQRQNGGLDLTICDDGHGIQPSDLPDDHYGLRGMQERAEAIGAQLAVESQPNQGTVVRLHLEVPRDKSID